ncbi:tRNA (adenosine(37)-N6)-threonylcarbamoyltransferase complex dimerization subunit type 1 TsaB [Myroides odoratimimus]|uniref:tRNA (adenosine(37)-N6)-threonylcarbamoyltransferase complex dimerization subunit type 1 TsaB n=1 Tax=Myroides odoratimimus TaxID=76832 RepID=UPI00257842BD|nr:tRNA (adenosine(37)-N6)-threonylcarbamoyltransferase complex dimerization subunit type 1 TsaB [Myroides odoratimimus]MDM1395811.1 tRNA (adenosine(37)-N6)-threonylcarbamoyltransferase complex dimerization subunit type 1 TsaB [Myroides odoratimimus]MDM1528220.1 tRNA (adenosine(37)-N6)-threonylcarbamoyltransferase complex dimerization subunit type 1 TsaB [Myroides odoratimimus]
MITILSIETATKNCSVSLSVSGEVIACKEIAEENFSHAEKLHVFVEEILKENNKTLKDLSAIAISQGPGSYTGLRIGVSSVKGLCYGLSIPLIALDTLEILARQVEVTEGLIVPMLDARRMEVFSAVFDKEYNKRSEIEAIVIDENAFSSYKGTLLHLIGDGAMKCKETLGTEGFMYYPEITYPSANEMGVMAYDKYIKEEFVDVAYFEPFYLKDFVLIQKKK